MISYAFTGQLGGAAPTFATNIADLEIAWVNGLPRLFAATLPGAGAGYSVYDISGASGLASQQGLQGYFSAVHHFSTPQMAILPGTGTGNMFLIAAGLAPSGWASYSLTGTGSFGSALNSAFAYDPTAIAAFAKGSASYTFLAADGKSVPYAYQIDSTGQFSLVRGSAAVTNGADISAMATVVTAQGGVLVTVSASSNLISSYRIGSAGELTAASTVTVDLGTGYSKPTDVTTISVSGISYAVVASAESSSLSVFRILPDGQLAEADHVVDNLATRFSHATALESFTVGNRGFVLAGGNDDGFDVMTLLPDGRLVHLMTVTDSAATSLANVTALAAAEIGNQIKLFAASATEPGISQFSLDLGTLGESLYKTAGSMVGTADNDLLVAGAFTTDVRGGDGDDILVAGDLGGAAELWGGAGRDLFVLSASATPIHIRDYQVGVDRLDLTSYPMLRNIGQLAITSTATGAEIAYQGNLIIIDSHDGNPIAPTAFAQSHLLRLTRFAPSQSSEILIGGAAADTLIATAAATSIMGFAGNDSLVGGIGNDDLDGDFGNDTLRGGGGNDSLSGGDGADWLLGDDGNDRLLGGAARDTLEGSAGNDTLEGGADNDHLSGGDDDDILWGGDGIDTLAGDAGNDELDGGDGNDSLAGGDGDDTIRAGAGNDMLYGGAGNDSLDGGDGTEQIFAGDGDDWADGGTGNDRLYGGTGNDTLQGGAGRDLIWGEEDNDSIDGGDDNDRLYGGSGDDTILGGGGIDLLYGDAGDDLLSGGDGNDRLFAGDGNDTISGGEGNDRIMAEAGDDLIYGDDGADQIRADIGNDTIYGGSGDDRLYGQAGDDHLIGDEGNDRLYGDIGNDTLDGGDGNDFLLGQLGDDLIYGGAGNDRILADAGDDTIYGGAGNDLVQGRDGSDRIWGGDDDDNLRGDNGDDFLSGDAGNDILTAGAGNDTRSGGAGADRLSGGSGADQFHYLSAADMGLGTSADQITDFRPGEDLLVFSGLGLHFSDDGTLDGAVGEVCYSGSRGGGTLLIDLDGDAMADCSINIARVSSLGPSDFLF
ncbi:MAG: calcium-binding protein [Paracoccaceae bacterium]